MEHSNSISCAAGSIEAWLHCLEDGSDKHKMLSSKIGSTLGTSATETGNKAVLMASSSEREERYDAARQQSSFRHGCAAGAGCLQITALLPCSYSIVPKFVDVVAN